MLMITELLTPPPGPLWRLVKQAGIDHDVPLRGGARSGGYDNATMPVSQETLRPGLGCGPHRKPGRAAVQGQGRATVNGVTRAGARTVAGVSESRIRVVKWPGLPVLPAMHS
jgi:hypothetical protein